jgi:hypothetical protein
MSVLERPHYEVSSIELAAWIEHQGAEIWWCVDGDRLLIWRLCFPCLAAKLAAELRAINQPLLVVDHTGRTPEPSGQQIGMERLDSLVSRPSDRIELKQGRATWPEYRVLHFSWKGLEEEWLLVEDKATTDRVRKETQHSGGRQKQ